MIANQNAYTLKPFLSILMRVKLKNDPIILCNRALVHLKCENFGSALSDKLCCNCTQSSKYKGIVLFTRLHFIAHYNISNIQAYYRRGMAYFALTKFTLAGRDFKKVSFCV